MTKETLYLLLADVDEGYVDAAHAPVKKAGCPWIKWVAVAACLGLILAGPRIFITDTADPTWPPSPSDPPQDVKPTVLPAPPPQAVQPPNNDFNSPEELLALQQATEGSEAEYLAYFESLNIFSDTDHLFSTQEGGREFISWLRSMPLPCRRDSDKTFHALYYYTKGNAKGFELFYDVAGIRYKLHCMDARYATKLEGESVATVSIGEYSFDLYEMEYGIGRRLFGNCYVGEQVLCIWINTTDPAQVDFSGFYLGDLLESFS